MKWSKLFKFCNPKWSVYIAGPHARYYPVSQCTTFRKLLKLLRGAALAFAMIPLLHCHCTAVFNPSEQNKLLAEGFLDKQKGLDKEQMYI